MAENRIQAGMSFEEKFLRNVYPEPNSGCWLWGGYSNNFGYGQIYVNGNRQSAHRFSFEYHNKVLLSKNEFVCHRCNITYCCNPNHLYVGSQSDNMTQAYNEGRFGLKNKPEKMVYQYSKELHFIKVHKSMMSAHRETKIAQSSISANCNGKLKNAGKFIWSFIPLSEIDEMELINNNKEWIGCVS